MKKSLSAIVSLAMAFSMFSSVAMGATSSADFTDLKDLDAATKAKFDALIKDGVFDGVSETTFGLKDKMNRAQFAKVAALIFGLKVDTTLTTSSFTDVKPTAEDPANGYALPYIEALKAAGLTDGFAPGQYNPAGDVTKQELATFLVRGLGWESQAKAHVGISDKSVSDWAKGYVGLAVEKKIIDVAAGTEFQGSAAATRELLVLSAHASKNANVPANVGISEVKASNYNQLTVSFNGPVSKDAAKLEVKRGTSAATVKEVKWSDDTRTATVILESKLTAADYSVTLSGITNLDSAKATATVKAEDEKVTKVEFLNASENFARGAEVRVDFRAVNQYGEAASVSANDFTINKSSDKVTVNNVSGKTSLKVNVDKSASINEKFSITIILTNSGISTSKVFNIAEDLRVTKVEFGDLKNENGEKVSYVKAGKSAYLGFDAFDQFGYKVTKKENLNTLNNGGGVTITSSNTSDVYFEGTNTPFVDDIDSDGFADLKVTAKDKIQGTYDITAYASGSVTSKKIDVAALKVPATLEFDTFNGTLAEGDVNKYVKIKAKDSQGTELTAQDIADSQSVLQAYGTGPIQLSTHNNSSIVTASGDDLGKIHIAAVNGKAPASIVVYLKDKPTVEARLNLNVQEQRKVQEVKFVDDLPASVVAGVTTGNFKFKTYDQHGSEIKGDTVAPKKDNYRIKISVIGANKVTLNTEVDGNLVPLVGGEQNSTDANIYSYTTKVADVYDKKIVIGNTGWTGSNEVRFEIIDITDNNKVVNSFSRTLRLINAADNKDDLNYAVSLDNQTENTLFGIVKYVDKSTVTADTYATSALAKEIKLDVTNDSGKKVVTDYKVTGAAPVNPNVARVVKDGDKYKIVGVDTGETNIVVTYDKAGGQDTATITVKVKKDLPTITSVNIDDSTHSVARASLDGGNANIWDLFDKLTVKDSYGTEYKEEDVLFTDENEFIRFSELFGIFYTVDNIEYTSDTSNNGKAENSIKIDRFGKLTVSNPNGKAIKSFKITAWVGGKTDSITINVN